MTEDIEKMLRITEKSADQAQITLDTGTDYSFSSKKSDIYVENSETTKYTVRLIKDEKLGGFSFYSPTELESSIKKALKATEFAEYLNVNFPEKKHIPNLDTFDRKISEIEVEEAAKDVKEMNEAAGEGCEFMGSAVGYSWDSMSIVNSNGLDYEWKSTSMSAWTESRTPDKKSTAIAADKSRRIFDLKKIGIKTSKQTSEQEGAANVEKGNYRLVFEGLALDQFVNSMLLGLFYGPNIPEGESIISEKLEEKVFSDKFYMSDEPHVNAASSLPIDSDGVATKKKELIEGGFLKNFLFGLENLAKAKKRKVKGIETQTAGNSPGDQSNIMIIGGENPDLTDSQKTILVRQMMGTHSFNETNGEFNIVISQGLLFENGEKKRAVIGTTVSANIMDWMKNIKLEKETSIIDNYIGPRLGFDNVSCI